MLRKICRFLTSVPVVPVVSQRVIVGPFVVVCVFVVTHVSVFCGGVVFVLLPVVGGVVPPPPLPVLPPPVLPPPVVGGVVAGGVVGGTYVQLCVVTGLPPVHSDGLDDVTVLDCVLFDWHVPYALYVKEVQV